MSNRDNPEHEWKVSVRYHDGGSVRWIPVTQSPSGAPLGISENHEWVVERSDLSVVTDVRKIPVAVLSVIEWPYDEAVRALANGLTDCSLPPDLTKSFPWNEIVECALRSRSSYWAEKAVTWLETGVDVDEHRNTLEDLVTSKWAEQGVRHRARRLLKQGRRRP